MLASSLQDAFGGSTAEPDADPSGTNWFEPAEGGNAGEGENAEPECQQQ